MSTALAFEVMRPLSQSVGAEPQAKRQATIEPLGLGYGLALLAWVLASVRLGATLDSDRRGRR